MVCICFGWLIIRKLFEFVCYNYCLLSLFILVYLSSLNIKIKLFSLLEWTKLCLWIWCENTFVLASCRIRAFINLIDCFIRLLIFLFMSAVALLVSNCNRGRKIAGLNPAAIWKWYSLEHWSNETRLSQAWSLISLMLCANLHKVQ